MEEEKYEKMVFFDLDGTLCSGGSLQVGQEIITAFNDLKKNDVLPIIATGRSRYEVKGLLDLLRVEHYILSNGCYVHSAGRTIQNMTFTIGEVEAILAIAKKYQLSAGYFNQRGYAITQFSEVVEEHVAHMGISEVPVVADFYQSNPVNFMNLYLNAEMEEKIREELGAIADLVRFAPLAIDVLPKNVSKGTAIKSLLTSLRDSQIETYAFGDQNNDISMFQLVDFGVAMSHSTEQLKRQSSYIATSTNGVIEGLKYYGLIS